MPTSDMEPALRQMSLIISEAEVRLQHALHELSLMKETLFLAMRSSSSSSRPTETPTPQLHWDHVSKQPEDKPSNTDRRGTLMNGLRQSWS